jgi:hypothetical protein
MFRSCLLLLGIAAVSLAGAICFGGASPMKPASTTRPAVLFGAVAHLDQLAEHPGQWKTAAEVADGFLFHVHFFVRGRDTLGNTFTPEQVRTVTTAIGRQVRGKANALELTFHIRDATTDPAAIAREHARNTADLQAFAPITDLHIDWILSIFKVAREQHPRLPDESDVAYGDRLIAVAASQTRAYIRTLREQGVTQRLHAVFPPIYLNESPWVRKGGNVDERTVQLSRLLHALFDAGFDGFTADSPRYLIANKTYEAEGYLGALRAAQSVCRERGKSFGLILNDDVEQTAPTLTGQSWDEAFAAASLATLADLPRLGLSPDRLIVESWYKGPYRLVPDSLPGTLTHTAAEVRGRVDAATTRPVP